MKICVWQNRINLCRRARGGGPVCRDMASLDISEMIARYEKLVYTICYQFTKDHSLAQDLTQETFISAFTHMSSCPEDAQRPWLARIATNKAKDYLKSAYHRRVAPTEDDSLDARPATVSYAAPAEDITLAKDAALRIKDKILALKEPYLQVSRLYFLEECTMEEIANRLERPLKTVHTQIYRAKQMLKAEIERSGEYGNIRK